MDLQFFYWEKINQAEQQASSPRIVGCFEGYLSLIWHHNNYRGISGHNQREYDYEGEWRGTCNNQHMDLGRPRPSSCLQYPNRNINQKFCSSAEPSQLCTLTREFGSVQICLIQILKQELLPYSLVCPSPGMELKHSSICYGESLLVSSNQKGCSQLLELLWPSVAKSRGGQANPLLSNIPLIFPNLSLLIS